MLKTDAAFSVRFLHRQTRTVARLVAFYIKVDGSNFVRVSRCQKRTHLKIIFVNNHVEVYFNFVAAIAFICIDAPPPPACPTLLNEKAPADKYRRFKKKSAAVIAEFHVILCLDRQR